MGMNIYELQQSISEQEGETLSKEEAQPVEEHDEEAIEEARRDDDGVEERALEEYEAQEEYKAQEEFKKDILIVSQNMIKYGGSFVRCLGEALSHADANNVKKIRQAFPEYWKEYLKAGL